MATALCPSVAPLYAQTLDAHLAGRITDSDGASVAARVIAYQRRVINGTLTLLPRCTTLTNQNGQYDCPSVPSGQFIVAATVLERQGHFAATPYFAPGATDLASAEPVALRSGSSGWADFHLPRGHGVVVTGKLNPAPNEAALTLNVQADEVVVDSHLRVRYESKTGTFMLEGVAPGHYLLVASWLVSDEEHVGVMPLIVSNSPVKDLRLDALANVTLVGHLADAAPTVLCGEMTLRSVDGLVPDLKTELHNRSFQFPSVPAGQYTLSAQGSESYIKSLVVGSQSFEGPTFSTGSAPTQTIEVDLGTPAVRLNGHVSTGAASELKADVIAISSQTGEIFHVITDGQQRFEFTGLAPGRYVLFAWPGIDYVPYRSKTLLQKYHDHGVSVLANPASVMNSIVLDSIE